MSETTADEIEAALRHLAFDSPADAVKLLLRSENLSDRKIKKLDLSLISGVKRSGNGITEIKFYDRLKALDCLSRFVSDDDNSQSSFLAALEKSAMADDLDEDEFC